MLFVLIVQVTRAGARGSTDPGALSASRKGADHGAASRSDSDAFDGLPFRMAMRNNVR
jgi:hypothetical protein